MQVDFPLLANARALLTPSPTTLLSPFALVATCIGCRIDHLYKYCSLCVTIATSLPTTTTRPIAQLTAIGVHLLATLEDS